MSRLQYNWHWRKRSGIPVARGLFDPLLTCNWILRDTTPWSEISWNEVVHCSSYVHTAIWLSPLKCYNYPADNPRRVGWRHCLEVWAKIFQILPVEKHKNLTSTVHVRVQAPVVQTLEIIIHRINHFPKYKCQGHQLRHPVDRDLSSW